MGCHLAIEGDAHGWVDWELRINDRLQDHPPIWQLCVTEPAVVLFPVEGDGSFSALPESRQDKQYKAVRKTAHFVPAECSCHLAKHCACTGRGHGHG